MGKSPTRVDFYPYQPGDLIRLRTQVWPLRGLDYGSPVPAGHPFVLVAGWPAMDVDVMELPQDLIRYHIPRVYTPYEERAWHLHLLDGDCNIILHWFDPDTDLLIEEA